MFSFRGVRLTPDKYSEWKPTENLGKDQKTNPNDSLGGIRTQDGEVEGKEKN